MKYTYTMSVVYDSDMEVDKEELGRNIERYIEALGVGKHVSVVMLKDKNK